MEVLATVRWFNVKGLYVLHHSLHLDLTFRPRKLNKTNTTGVFICKFQNFNFNLVHWETEWTFLLRKSMWKILWKGVKLIFFSIYYPQYQFVRTLLPIETSSFYGQEEKYWTKLLKVFKWTIKEGFQEGVLSK